MEKKVFVDISARHVHLSREDLDMLYGEGYALTPKKMLGGGFAAQERVDLVGPRSTVKGVSILGPCRHTQVELTITEARALGVAAPIRLSGDVEGTPGIKLVGPHGELDISKGVIVAKRHLHITKADADAWGLSSDACVKVRIVTQDRTTVYENIPCRVAPDGPPPTIHLDTDEANAAGMFHAMEAYLLD